jgi:TolB-like protein
VKKAVLLAALFAILTAALFAQNAELPRLAVVEFSTNSSKEKVKADAITVRNLVESQMVGARKYQVITRDEIDKLLANQRIQVSSISSAENIKKLQLQNISYIVTGSVDEMDNDYALTVKVLDVSTGQFSHSDNDFMSSASRDFYNGVNTLMARFVIGMESKDGQLVQTGQKQIIYTIGDRGPGGGFIFYAEGGAYMEVSLPLGSYNWDDAIKAAKNYKGGGFSDWHLPSQSDLDMIYQNLRRRNLAGLGDDYYWSSAEYHANLAWFQVFSNGTQSFDYKNYSYLVRAVRAF